MRFFSPSGKRGRIEYIAVHIGTALVLLALITLTWIATGTAGVLGEAMRWVFTVGLIGALYVITINIICRLRDAGWSSWVVIVAYVPFLGFFLQLALAIMPPAKEA